MYLLKNPFLCVCRQGDDACFQWRASKSWKYENVLAFLSSTDDVEKCRQSKSFWFTKSLQISSTLPRVLINEFSVFTTNAFTSLKADSTTNLNSKITFRYLQKVRKMRDQTKYKNYTSLSIFQMIPTKLTQRMSLILRSLCDVHSRSLTCKAWKFYNSWKSARYRVQKDLTFNKSHALNATTSFLSYKFHFTIFFLLLLFAPVTNLFKFFGERAT